MRLTLSPESVGPITATVEGDIDLAVADELRIAGCEAIAARPNETMRLDLSEVTFIDSSGLNALIAIRNATTKPVVLVNPASTVLRILQLTALDQAFVIESDDAGSAG